MDKKAMYKLTYGLFVLTAREGDKDNGCIINTAMQVTTTPNRVIVVVNKQNYTHDMIHRTKQFNISCLSEDATFDVFQHFGFQSGKDVDKMPEGPYPRAQNGVMYLKEKACAYISGNVVAETDLGTHTMFLADVTDAEVLSDSAPVSYSFYQKNIKPAQKPTEKTGWICKICGYIYEGEELPEDYICPICKHPASDFEPLK